MPVPTLSSLALIAALGVDPAPQPSATQEALYRALTVREGAPTCAALATLSPTLVEDLIFLTEHAKQPAWVGVRAAECLLAEHQEAAMPVLVGWMGRADAKGFALLTIEKLDAMPIDRAMSLAQAGLAGPMAEALRPRIARLAKPELAALAKPASP